MRAIPERLRDASCGGAVHIDYLYLYRVYGVCVQDNGGRPVSHYIVEKKDKKSGVWSPVSRFCRSPLLDVTGLDDGEQYEFRVSAVNDLGQSEPLVTDKPIVAKYQFGTYDGC